MVKVGDKVKVTLTNHHANIWNGEYEVVEIPDPEAQDAYRRLIRGIGEGLVIAVDHPVDGRGDILPDEYKIIEEK